MTDIFDLQTAFMTQAQQNLEPMNYRQASLYWKLIFEECAEFFEECAAHDPESIKEACDILVVTSGYLISLLGTEKAKQAYELVHASNMAKVQGNIEKRDDGKVLKSDAWKKEVKDKLMADLQALVG